MKKEVTLIFLLLEHCSSLVTWITHFICCRSQKTKFMVLLFLCWLLILESYVQFRLVLQVIALPTVIQWSFPYRRDLTLKAMQQPHFMDAMFVLHGMFLKAYAIRQFLLRETNARFILIERPFSSFTQTSSEFKKMIMAKDSILTVLCLCTSMFRVLYKGCKHTRDSTRTWVALNSCQSTIVHNHGFFSK